MPQAFRTPFGGLNEGLLQGFKMGLLKQQMEKENRLLDLKLKTTLNKEREYQFALMEKAAAIMADENVPKEVRLKAYNNFASLWNKFNPDNPMGGLSEWPDIGGKFAKRALKIWQNPQYDFKTKQTMLAALKAEAESAGKTIRIDDLVEPLRREEEAANIRQAMDLQRLQKDPRFLALTPEQREQAGIPGAREELLARGGDLGQKILEAEALKDIKKEIKAAGRPETTINLPGELRIAKIDPENYTPESVYEFAKTGDYKVLKPRKKAEKEEGRIRVTKTLTELRDLYDELAKMGAIVNVENNTVDNILAAASASNIGQFAGRVLGSKAQSIRNTINSIRPLLIQDMRKASEMGARGLDSEKELEFYLQAATDPKRDLQANIAAINVLNAAYGLGNKILSKKEREAKEKELIEAKKEAASMGIEYREKQTAPRFEIIEVQ